MSVEEVQARVRVIEQRLAALGAPHRSVRSGSGTDYAAAAAAAEARLASGGAVVTGSPTLVMGGLARSSDGVTGEQVVATALRQVGTPYVWGGEQPGGFDCSGLLQWSFAQHGVDLPRVSGDQSRVGREVSAAEARPGDLVFFERGAVDHIGLYAGGGRWVVAPRTGETVRVEDVDLSKATTIRRVLPDTALGARRVATGSGVADPSLTGLPPAGRRYAAEITAAAQRHGVEPALLAAVAWSESGFNPRAGSPAGAQGLMQLMPRTAASLGVDPLDPAQALDGGARYLAEQLDRFGTPELALAAYNAGPTAVRRHGGVPPYAETQGYVRTVLDRYTRLGGAA